MECNNNNKKVAGQELIAHKPKTGAHYIPRIL